eukprot:scaffold151888_cov31-Tisochrysis_lutea.AAC.1
MDGGDTPSALALPRCPFPHSPRHFHASLHEVEKRSQAMGPIGISRDGQAKSSWRSSKGRVKGVKVGHGLAPFPRVRRSGCRTRWDVAGKRDRGRHTDPGCPPRMRPDSFLPHTGAGLA